MVGIGISTLLALLPLLSGMQLVTATPISNITQRADELTIHRKIHLMNWHPKPNGAGTDLDPPEGVSFSAPDVNDVQHGMLPFNTVTTGTGGVTKIFIPSAVRGEKDVETNRFIVKMGDTTAQCHLEIDENKVKINANPDVYDYVDPIKGADYPRAAFIFQPGRFFLWPCGYDPLQDWVRVVCENEAALCDMGISKDDWKLKRPAGQ